MTGRIDLAPEAARQLDDIDDWIAERVSADVARRFVQGLLEHIDGLLLFPRSGHPRDDVRSGVRTTTYKKRTLIAYAVDEAAGDVVTVLGVFCGGQNWEVVLSTDRDSESD